MANTNQNINLRKLKQKRKSGKSKPNQNKKTENKSFYFFINRTLFFPKQGILVIGDLHLGYEAMLIKSGLLTPKMQNKKVISDLKSTFKEIKKKGYKLKKIVFLGDIKHAFAYEAEEKFSFREVYDFLQENLDEKDIIFIKGNHDTIDYTFNDKLKNYYICNAGKTGKDKDEKIAFIHGHESFPEVFDKKVKTIVMGHIHPSVLFNDPDTSKKEKYKCFLIGKYKGKEIIILPSFLTISIGQPVNNYDDIYEDYFSIIPRKKILDFNVHVVGEKEIYDFGKVKKL
ncbi:hypothetical protein GF378_03180 [Candidatus Pacearchaeota archaeon]|nr:hypothetical protein [Candidatus Pacearchaeota archaeon]